MRGANAGVRFALLLLAIVALGRAERPALADHSHTGLVSKGVINGDGAFDVFFRGASADGTRVFFTTSEKLTNEDNTDSSQDVYERSGGVTTLVSKGEINGDGAFDAVFRGASADGTRVFFITQEQLTTDDNTDSSFDTYERSGGVTTLVSKGAINGNGAFTAFFRGASADGTRVFFTTDEKLTNDDNTDSSQDIYEATVERVGFAAAGSAVAESSGTATITVELERSAPGTVTVDYAVTGGSAGGADRVLAPGTLTFAPGETSKTISVDITQDLLDEPAETVVVTLSNPGNTALGAVTTHTLSIIDDDATVGFAAIAAPKGESAGMVKVRVELTDPLAGTVTVAYQVSGGTAAAGKDYTLRGGELVFRPGQTAKDILVTLRNDFLVESSETIVIKLLSPSGAQPGRLTHTLTITDDERRLKCGGKPATMVGSNANNTLNGTAGADVIVGRGGNDTINGKGGADTLCGSGGSDTIAGGNGADTIEGGLGNDTLKGDGGRDAVKGQGGKDRLSGGSGVGDACDGGPGVDALLPSHGCETVAGVP